MREHAPDDLTVAPVGLTLFLVCGTHLPARINCTNQKLVVIRIGVPGTPRAKALRRAAWICALVVVLCYRKEVSIGFFSKHASPSFTPLMINCWPSTDLNPLQFMSD